MTVELTVAEAGLISVLLCESTGQLEAQLTQETNPAAIAYLEQRLRENAELAAKLTPFELETK